MASYGVGPCRIPLHVVVQRPSVNESLEEDRLVTTKVVVDTQEDCRDEAFSDFMLEYDPLGRLHEPSNLEPIRFRHRLMVSVEEVPHGKLHTPLAFEGARSYKARWRFCFFAAQKRWINT